jgi:hypothetical protein
MLTLEEAQTKKRNTSIPNKAISLRTRVEPLVGSTGREKIVMIITQTVKKQYNSFRHFNDSFMTGRDTMYQNLFHGLVMMVVGTKQKKKYKVVQA